MIPRLLHIANSQPDAVNRDWFYAMKTRILTRWARPDGFDIQHIPGAECWGCDGSGVFYHASGTGDCCHRCYGSGWYKSPVYVHLERWRFGGFIFHQPLRRYRVLPTDLLELFDMPAEPTIEGYVRHGRYSNRAAARATFLLGLIFDRRLSWRVAREAFNRLWLVRVSSRRCLDCRRRTWSTRRWRCRPCEYLNERDAKRVLNNPPF